MLSVPIKLRTKIRLSTAAFFFLSGIISATWASRIPEIQEKFLLSESRWGGVLFALPAGLVAGLPVSSWLIEKFTSARMMTVSGVIFALLLSSLCIAPNVLTLIIFLFCFGFSRSFFTMSLNTNSIEVQNVYQKPIIASFHGVWSLASFCAAAIGTFMISGNIDPAVHFSIISFAVIVLILLNIRKGNTRKEAAEKKPFFIKPDRYLFILGLITFCTMSCEVTVFDWAVNYFKKVVKADRQMVVAGYTAFIITMTLGRMMGDKILAFLGLQKVLLFSGALMSLGFFITVFFPYLYMATLGFLLIGLGDSIIIPTVYSLAGKSAKMKPNYAIASVTMIGYIGFLSAPLTVGSISQKWGMPSAFTLMAVLSFFISVLAIILSKQKEMKVALST
jgi:MFS family permease